MALRKLDPERIYVADIESDGLIPDMTRVHLITCGALRSTETLVFRQNEDDNFIEAGLRHLMDMAQEGWIIAFHNGIGFDYPAIRKLYPWFELPDGSLFDSLVYVRLKYPDMMKRDAKLVAKGTLPGNLRGRHSLEAWGYRANVMKGEYTGDPAIADEKERKRRKWERWNQSMEDYAVQDIVATRATIELTKPWDYAAEAIDIEHEVAWIICRQERRGFAFDELAAADLYGTLAQQQGDLRRDLELNTPPQCTRDGKPLTPKRDNVARGYTGGAPLSKLKWTPFNPTSRQQVATLLKLRHGWVPEKFSDNGDPAIDESVLGALDYPEAKPLTLLFTLAKRTGMIAEGDQAWLKVVRGGRIFGRVNSNGAVTGRMTHMQPNVAQVPKVGSLYGKECRALFIAGVGLVLVGADASGLELRMLAHYTARWDGGAYAKAVVEGKESEGTDVHSLNCKALGFDPQKIYQIGGKQAKGRDIAKTFIYAFLGPKGLRGFTR